MSQYMCTKSWECDAHSGAFQSVLRSGFLGVEGLIGFAVFVESQDCNTFYEERICFWLWLWSKFLFACSFGQVFTSVMICQLESLYMSSSLFGWEEMPSVTQDPYNKSNFLRHLRFAIGSYHSHVCAKEVGHGGRWRRGRHHLWLTGEVEVVAL